MLRSPTFPPSHADERPHSSAGVRNNTHPRCPQILSTVRPPSHGPVRCRLGILALAGRHAPRQTGSSFPRVRAAQQGRDGAAAPEAPEAPDSQDRRHSPSPAAAPSPGGGAGSTHGRPASASASPGGASHRRLSDTCAGRCRAKGRERAQVPEGDVQPGSGLRSAGPCVGAVASAPWAAPCGARGAVGVGHSSRGSTCSPQSVTGSWAARPWPPRPWPRSCPARGFGQMTSDLGSWEEGELEACVPPAVTSCGSESGPNGTDWRNALG